MTSVTVSRAWKVVKPHVPLIKFRKGGPAGEDHNLSGASKSPQTSPTPHGSPGSSGTTCPEKPPTGALDDSQLPVRYCRKPMSEQEMEYINRGGPD